MTTPHPKAADEKRRERFVLPDPPEGEPEDMTSFDHLTLSGSAHHLAQHLGSPETTLVAGERYLTRASRSSCVGKDGTRPAHRLQRRTRNLPGEQRLHHLRSGHLLDRHVGRFVAGVAATIGEWFCAPGAEP